MAYALVGVAGVAVGGGTGASVTPTWGTSETRAAGNLLVLCVSCTNTATLPAAPAGWSTAIQQAGTNCSSSIFYKIAAGGDAAPTVAGVASGFLFTELTEWSGGAPASPLDQTAGNAGTTTPLVATAGGVDVASGQLVVAVAGVRVSVAQANTGSLHTFNNGVSNSVDINNTATSAVNHYHFHHGITTGHASADSDSYAYNVANITGAVLSVASFKLPSSTVTGDASITLAGPTTAADGSVLVQGDASATLATPTASGTATLPIQGASSAQLAAPVAAGTGAVLVQGSESGSITLALSASGGVLVQGVGLGYLAATATGTGTVGSTPINGDALLTLAPLAAGQGAVLVQGSATAQFALTAQGAGTGPTRTITTFPIYSKRLGIWW